MSMYQKQYILSSLNIPLITLTQSIKYCAVTAGLLFVEATANHIILLEYLKKYWGDWSEI